MKTVKSIKPFSDNKSQWPKSEKPIFLTKENVVSLEKTSDGNVLIEFDETIKPVGKHEKTSEGNILLGLSNLVNQATKKPDENVKKIPVDYVQVLNELLVKHNIKVDGEDFVLDVIKALKAGKKAKSKSYVFKKGITKPLPTDKMPLQMLILVENIEDDISLDTWAGLVSNDTRFTTRQSAKAIIKFYMKRMLDSGYISK